MTIKQKVKKELAECYSTQKWFWNGDILDGIEKAIDLTEKLIREECENKLDNARLQGIATGEHTTLQRIKKGVEDLKCRYTATEGYSEGYANGWDVALDNVLKIVEAKGDGL